MTLDINPVPYEANYLRPPYVIYNVYTFKECKRSVWGSNYKKARLQRKKNWKRTQWHWILKLCQARNQGRRCIVPKGFDSFWTFIFSNPWNRFALLFTFSKDPKQLGKIWNNIALLLTCLNWDQILIFFFSVYLLQRVSGAGMWIILRVLDRF